MPVVVVLQLMVAFEEEVVDGDDDGAVDELRSQNDFGGAEMDHQYELTVVHGYQQTSKDLMKMILEDADAITMMDLMLKENERVVVVVVVVADDDGYDGDFQMVQ